MQRYFAKVVDNRVILSDSDIHHIKNVMRMNIGDKIEVVNDNILYICNIIELTPVRVNIEEIRKEDNKINLDVVIAIGLVKEQKMDLILQKLTELGVQEIIPVNMERSIVKLDSKREEKKLIRWQSICKEASEQSKRSNVPIVREVVSLKELIKIEADLKLVASTKEKDKMFDYYLQNINNYAKIIMVVGPEGGISDREEEFLCNNNYNRVSFGDLIFRVETAAIYAASIFNFYGSKR